MVDPSDPLGHTVVVGILCLEQKLERATGDRRRQTVAGSGQTTVGANPTQGRIPIRDQPQGYIVARKSRHRRPEDCPDDVIVEIRGPQGYLSLLEHLKTVMVPRRLPKYRKGQGMDLNDPIVR